MSQSFKNDQNPHGYWVSFDLTYLQAFHCGKTCGGDCGKKLRCRQWLNLRQHQSFYEKFTRLYLTISVPAHPPVPPCTSTPTISGKTDE